MNRSIAFITAFVLAAGLTGCGSEAGGGADISKPPTSVTATPTAPIHAGPRCRDHLVCPR